MVPDVLGSPKGLTIEEQIAWASHCDQPRKGKTLVDGWRLSEALDHEMSNTVEDLDE